MKSKKQRRALALIAAIMLVLAMLPSAVFAEGADQETYVDTAGNMAFSGETINLTNGFMFGGFGSGKTVTINKSVVEDALALAGYTVGALDSQIASSLLTAGYNVNIDRCQVGGNIFAAGYSIDVDAETSSRSFYGAARSVSYEGTASAAAIAAGSVYFNGKVDGNVYIDADSAVIGSDAEITGALHITSPEMPEIPAGAQIGEIAYTESKPSAVDVDVQIEPNASAPNMLVVKAKHTLYWIAAMAVVSLLFSWLIGGHLNRAKDMVSAEKKVGKVIGFGFLAMVAGPAVTIALMITVIGLPVAALICTAYILAICFAAAFAGSSLGRLVLPNMKPWLASVIGVAALEILKAIPYLGALVSIAAIVYTLGYIVTGAFRKPGKDIAPEDYAGGIPSDISDVFSPEGSYSGPDNA